MTISETDAGQSAPVLSSREALSMNATRIATAAALGFRFNGHLASGAVWPRPGRPTPRRRRGASCSGCHHRAQRRDTTVPRLIGRNPADIVTAMQAFKSGQLPSTVMDRIAKGFSDDEIKAIAAWYGAQKD